MRRAKSFLNTLFRHTWEHRGVLPGILVILVVLLAWVFRHSLTPYNPSQVYPSKALLPPFTDGRLLGTDEFGRDTLARLLAGIPVSLLFGVTPAVIGMVIGLSLGMIVALVSGWFGHVMMAGIDVLLAFPFILLAILLESVYGISLTVTIVAVTFAVFPTNTRLIRSETLSILARDFITAAKIGGAGKFAIMRRHLLPNVLPLALIVTSTDVGIMITLTAGLSFLGLGVQPPSVDWGTLISGGAPYISSAPILAFAPCLVVVMVGLAFASIADSERRRQGRAIQ
jgi:ABC-type dipeptide/oligopeptide/nickel transport system permease subunit